MVSGYERRFKGVGETVLRMSSSEFEDWMEVSDQDAHSSVEAYLFGDCRDSRSKIGFIRTVSQAPIIALLDQRSLQQIIALFQSGVDDVVTKPVHFDELIIRIATIKKRQLTAAPASENKSVKVFFDGRDPEFANRPISLPRRQRRILEYLASINGRRVTKTQIFGAIYGIYDEHIDENVVESHISKLRKKLREATGFDPIDSKRYLGYRLNPKTIDVCKFGDALASPELSTAA